jgi:hypothetical protein
VGRAHRRIRWHNWCVFHLGDRTLTLIHQELADGTVMHSEAWRLHGDGRVQRLQITGTAWSMTRTTARSPRALEFDSRRRPAEARVRARRTAMRLAGAGYTDAQGERSATACSATSTT